MQANIGRSLVKKILNFLQNETEGTTGEYQLQLCDDTFIGSLAFFAEISNHFYILNIKLQGKKQNRFQLVEHSEGFCKKLVPLRASLQRNDATYIPSCSELLGKGISIDFSAIFEKFNKINDRFADFDLLKAKMEPLNNTIKVDIESQPLYLQQELCEL